MRQVPAFTSYLLLGDGRMARHAALYLKLLQLPFATWTRSNGSEALVRLARDASHVLVLVSDRSIEALLLEHPILREKICVHFSGSVTTELAVGAHPLMTFTEQPYSFAEYRRIPFVIEKGRGEMSELLPGFPNPSYAIDAKSKALYHSLCVMAGNFTVLLWEKAFSAFSSRFGLPKAVLIPYLERISKNLVESKPGESVLTGPLVRRDRATIESNLDSLEGDPFANVYRAFVSAHEGTHERGGPHENRP
jgi:2-dehydropantoate 2-reductase